MRRVPESGGISPATNSMSVLLPAPVGPTIATTRPLATSSETRSRAGRSSDGNVNASDSTCTPAGFVGGRDRQRRVGLDRLVEHLADPGPAGERERQLRQHVADQAEGEHQEREQVHEAGQLADGEVATAHPVRAHHDQPDVGQRREHVEQRFERPPQAHGVDPGVAQPPRHGRQPLGLPRLGSVGLDQLHALEALVDARRQLAQVLLGLVVEAIRPPLVRDVDADEEREHGDGDRAEDEVGDEQPDRRDDDQQNRPRRRTAREPAPRPRCRCRRRPDRRGRRRVGAGATRSVAG